MPHFRYSEGFWICFDFRIYPSSEYARSPLFKRRLFFQRQMRNFFRTKLFPNIRVVLTILLCNSLLKMNYLYYQFWTKESLSFSEAVARKCSIKKFRKKFCQNSLATLLKKRLRHTCIFVNLAKFFKKTLQNTCEWLVLDFAQFYMSQSIIHSSGVTVRKEIIIFVYIKQDFNIGELSPKEIIICENATFRYIFFRRARHEIIH